MKVLSDVHSLTCLDDYVEQADESALEEAGHLIENLVLCDRIITVARGVDDWGLRPLCDRFEGVFEYLDESHESPSLAALRSGALASDMRNPSDTDRYLDRVHHYSELATELDVYLCPHPSRTAHLFDGVQGPASKPVGKRVVEFFDERMSQSTGAHLAGIDFSVPPIIDYVLSTCRNQGVDLATAVNDIRSSKNAVRFRSWCAELDDELRSREGRAMTQATQRLAREVDATAQAWQTDLNLGVKYALRTVSLRNLWVVGGLISALGFGEFPVRYPVIIQKRKHLLFLNDIYRTTPPR